MNDIKKTNENEPDDELILEDYDKAATDSTNMAMLENGQLQPKDL